MVASEFVFYQSVQFSVRKCSRTAFAKLNIWSCVKLTACPEPVHIGSSSVNITTSFNKNWICTASCQNKCRKQSSRTCSDNNGGGRIAKFHLIIFILSRNLSVTALFADFILVDIKFSVNGCKKVDIILFSCVNRSAKNLTAFYGFFFNPQLFGNCLANRFIIVVKA